MLYDSFGGPLQLGVVLVIILFISFKQFCECYNIPKTKKFDCLGRGDLTFLFYSKVLK